MLELASVDIVLVDSPKALRELDERKLGGHLWVQEVAESSLRGLGIVREHIAVQSQNYSPFRQRVGHAYLRSSSRSLSLCS